jgi:hypothetical protein
MDTDEKRMQSDQQENSAVGRVRASDPRAAARGEPNFSHSIRRFGSRGRHPPCISASPQLPTHLERAEVVARVRHGILHHLKSGGAIILVVIAASHRKTHVTKCGGEARVRRKREEFRSFWKISHLSAQPKLNCNKLRKLQKQ